MTSPTMTAAFSEKANRAQARRGLFQFIIEDAPKYPLASERLKQKLTVMRETGMRDVLLSYDQTAALAGVCKNTVRQWVSRGHLRIVSRYKRGGGKLANCGNRRQCKCYLSYAEVSDWLWGRSRW